jgi:hypothetical protein
MTVIFASALRSISIFLKATSPPPITKTGLCIKLIKIGKLFIASFYMFIER